MTSTTNQMMYKSPEGLTIRDMPFGSMAELKAMKHRRGVLLELPVMHNETSTERRVMEIHGIYDTKNDGEHVVQVEFGNARLKGIETKYQPIIGFLDFSKLPNISYKLLVGDT